MLTFWNTNHGLRTIEQWEPNCWVQVTCPSQEDINFLQNDLHVPDYYISDIADTDERARYDIDEGWVQLDSPLLDVCCQSPVPIMLVPEHSRQSLFQP